MLKLLGRPLVVFFLLVILPLTFYLLTTEKWYYALLPGAGAMGLFILGNRPQLGYYLIVFFIPLTMFRTLTQSLTITKIVAFWVIAFVFLYLVLNRRAYFNISSPLWVWLIAFLLINLLSSLISDYSAVAYNGLRKLVNAYLFFLLTLVFVTRRGFFRILPRVIMSAAVFGSFLSVFGSLFGFSAFYDTQGYSVELNRAIGADADPNGFSFVILFSLPFFAQWFFSSPALSRRILAAGAFALCTTAVIMSFSRGGAIIFLVVMMLLSVEHLKRFQVRYLGLTIAFFGVALLLLIFLTPETYWERQKRVTDMEDPAISRRASYLVVTFENFLKRPLLGAGTDSFRNLYSESRISRRYSGAEYNYMRAAHNAYAEVLSGSGFLGLLVFLIMIGISLRGFQTAKSHYLARGQAREASMMTAYRLGFVTILLFFFFLSFNYHKYFWLSLALSQVALRFIGHEHPDNLQEVD